MHESLIHDSLTRSAMQLSFLGMNHLRLLSPPSSRIKQQRWLMRSGVSPDPAMVWPRLRMRIVPGLARGLRAGGAGRWGAGAWWCGVQGGCKGSPEYLSGLRAPGSADPRRAQKRRARRPGCAFRQRAGRPGLAGVMPPATCLFMPALISRCTRHQAACGMPQRM